MEEAEGSVPEENMGQQVRAEKKTPLVMTKGWRVCSGAYKGND